MEKKKQYRLKTWNAKSPAYAGMVVCREPGRRTTEKMDEERLGHRVDADEILKKCYRTCSF